MELTENYGRLRAEALPEIQLLLVETQFLDTGLQEECVYCGAHIEEDKLVCNDGHDLPRCCLSMAQVRYISIFQFRGKLYNFEYFLIFFCDLCAFFLSTPKIPKTSLYFQQMPIR